MVQRKKIITFNTYAILLLGCLFISNSAFPSVFGYLIVPVAIYLAFLSKEKDPVFINEIVTILTLIVLWH
jgi:hypothetical protein